MKIEVTDKTSVNHAHHLLTSGAIVGIIGISTLFLAVIFITYIVHRDSQNEVVKMPEFRLPIVIPFTTAARIRRAKAEVRLAQIEADLYEARHNKLQKELIYTDLDNERYKRALGSGE